MQNQLNPLRPVRDLTVFFLIAFAVLGLATGYWNFVARESLVSRDDNPRTVILYHRAQSERGSILDRNGIALAETTGEPDDFARRYDSSAAQILGYASFRYGLSGIEAATDATLSGGESLNDFERWRHDLLGEQQVGRDVQLTLDLNWQQATFSALANRPGAIVVVAPHSGDLLALASSPSFDPAQLDTDFETFTANANGPLINRATAAVYPAGELLSLFPSILDLPSSPDLPVPTVAASDGKISPLQFALLTAAIVNNGEMPAPRLIAAIQSAKGNEWVEQTATGHPVAVIPPDVAGQLQSQFESNGARSGFPLPGYAATLPSGFGDGTVGWFIGFAPDGSYAICVLLEDGTDDEAALVAQSLLSPAGDR